MCELFAMSSGCQLTAQEYLPPFADKARANISGWGIGFFRNGHVHIEKSCDGIFVDDQLHDAFRRLARVIDSRIILSHIRCPKAGHQKESHAQPLTDRFLDHNWLFICAAESDKLMAYQSPRPLMAEELVGARVLEFVRDRMTADLDAEPRQSLYQVLALGCKQLITTYPGRYSFFLANESVLFAFFNHAQVLTYRTPEELGETLLITTVSGGLTHGGNWHAYRQEDPSRGQIIMISGADLLYLGHL